MPYADIETRRQKDREKYKRNRGEVLAARRAYYAANRERIRAERSRKRTPEQRQRATERMKLLYAELRTEMIEAYGGQCKCCGESEATFLELDHIHSDGSAHRRKIGRGSHNTYRWAKKHGWPKDVFRLLCANCNQGRQRNGGVCPHEQR